MNGLAPTCNGPSKPQNTPSTHLRSAICLHRLRSFSLEEALAIETIAIAAAAAAVDAVISRRGRAGWRQKCEEEEIQLQE
jgi:hypothetical protein